MENTSTMKLTKAFVASLILALALAVVPIPAQAQVTGTTSLPLTYTVSETVSVSVSPATPLALTTSQQTVTVTTSWNLASTRTQIGTLAYFASTNALSVGGVAPFIPSSSISTQAAGVGTGTEAPCNLTAGAPAPAIFTGLGTPGATCNVIFYNTALGATLTGNNVQAYQIRLNTAPTTVGAYTGSLIFFAQAI
jgi:hypothetical protein